MKRGAICFALCAVGGALGILFVLFQSKPSTSSSANPSAQTVSLGMSATPGSQPARSKSFVPATPPQNFLTAQSDGTPSFASGDAIQRKAAANDLDLTAVKGMVRDYRATFGENPIGNNAEITKALLGGNARGAQFSNPQAKIDKENQLVDRWNHPYFFHQLSKIDMEVRSAGPDGVMWTTDDEVSP